uniref:Apple domain-containing protein n=1 Tax=Setaria digitata TaxID=48799 RepID=A0A915Q3Z2_9BILA
MQVESVTVHGGVDKSAGKERSFTWEPREKTCHPSDGTRLLCVCSKLCDASRMCDDSSLFSYWEWGEKRGPLWKDNTYGDCQIRSTGASTRRFQRLFLHRQQAVTVIRFVCVAF